MARNTVNTFKTRAFWATAATVVLIGALGLGTVAGYRELSHAAGTHRGTQGPVSVRFNWPVHPTTPAAPDGSPRSWLPLKVQQELTDLALEHVTPDTTDGAALARATAAMEQTGWFESIECVRRADGNAVEVIGRWRTPVAVVRVAGPAGQVDRLISAKAELLPIDYPAGTTAMRYITGAARQAPAGYGIEWEGTDVQAGLKLLAYLYSSTVYGQVAGVDVSQYATGKRLAIVTDSGAKVVWGAAPDDWAPSEPSADQKLAWLTYLRGAPEYGRRIDAGRPLVDITSPRGIMRDQSGVTEGGTEQAAEAPADGHFESRQGPADRRRADRR
ncbi:MAG TPA: hypothetical protein VFF65_00930 [Phycisphaerales bacterium]|nr:hypothetical protein [Phycisphaerales bacterium]